ncbi:MAG: hypothetical protein JNK72_22295 [Myxococcales bacterium]|nr:hypothetical protein [Myxococcales bacterium]
MTDPEKHRLPPCGLYKTTLRLGAIAAGRLVYFHNHGTPDPGVYLPVAWRHHRAQFSPEGTPIPAPWWAASLAPLRPEGLYRVRETFFCCERGCSVFEAETLVQLAYTAEAAAMLFRVRWHGDGRLDAEALGRMIAPEGLARLAPLKLASVDADSESQ